MSILSIADSAEFVFCALKIRKARIFHRLDITYSNVQPEEFIDAS